MESCWGSDAMNKDCLWYVKLSDVSSSCSVVPLSASGLSDMGDPRSKFVVFCTPISQQILEVLLDYAKSKKIVQIEAWNRDTQAYTRRDGYIMRAHFEKKDAESPAVCISWEFTYRDPPVGGIADYRKSAIDAFMATGCTELTCDEDVLITDSSFGLVEKLPKWVFEIGPQETPGYIMVKKKDGNGLDVLLEVCPYGFKLITDTHSKNRILQLVHESV